MWNLELAKNFRDTDLKSLRRENLGVHYNFVAQEPILQKLHSFLNFIIQNQNVDFLSENEFRLINEKIQQFVNLRNKITSFDSSQLNSAYEHDLLVADINAQYQDSVQTLRAIYTYIKLSRVNLEDVSGNVNEILSRAVESEKTIQNQTGKLSSMIADYEHRISQSTNDLQRRITDSVTGLQSKINEAENTLRGKLREVDGEVRAKISDTERRTHEVVEDTRKKTLEVVENAKKFSAKEVLTKYSEIYDNQAEKENKPQIRRWSQLLVLSVVIELNAALWLFLAFSPYFFLEKTSSLAIASILGVKIFILSILAIFVHHTVKNFNAQSHLYAANKGKANSLASLKAFLDATDDPDIREEIIREAAHAVYSPIISGYLSKDDSNIASAVATRDLFGKDD